jgi:hypothetical protein
MIAESKDSASSILMGIFDKRHLPIPGETCWLICNTLLLQQEQLPQSQQMPG